MRVLIVYESMFGNTMLIAQAIAEGLRDWADVEILDVADAPLDALAESDAAAVILGGPTHVFSMSRMSTRQTAAAKGGAFTDVTLGIRDWLSSQPTGRHEQRFVAFDTRADARFLPGAASVAATRMARRKGFAVLDPESFLVEGYEGPLVPGEVERARSWGARLGQVLTG